ncbi:MAG: hypothetical protein ACTHKP_13910 [Nitrososphaeraceae archaeon]
MTDDITINNLQIKSLDGKIIYNDSLIQKLTDDELYYEDYLRYQSCFQCGKDHRFKPSFIDVQTSIDHIPELIALFFNEGCSQDDTQGIHGHKYDPGVIHHIINQIFDRTGKAVE